MIDCPGPLTEFELEPKDFPGEVRRTFPLWQSFRLQILRALTLLLGPLPLLVAFHNQRTDNRCERFVI